MALVASSLILHCAGGTFVMKPAEQCGYNPSQTGEQKVITGSGVLSQKWQGDRLIVKTFIRQICDGTTVTGRHQVEGNLLILKYHERITGDPTKCRCYQAYENQIANLEKRDYKIKVEFDD